MFDWFLLMKNIFNLEPVSFLTKSQYPTQSGVFFFTVKQARKHIRPNHGRWKSSATTDKLGWRYSGGVRRGSNTQVYSSAIKFKIGYVGFSTCSHEKFKPEMYKIVLNKGALRSCSSFLILFWVFCGCHKITTVIYFFWTIFTGFLPVS